MLIEVLTEKPDLNTQFFGGGGFDSEKVKEKEINSFQLLEPALKSKQKHRSENLTAKVVLEIKKPNRAEVVKETFETMIVALPVAKSELTLKAACELRMHDDIGRSPPSGSSKTGFWKLRGLSNSALEECCNGDFFETIMEHTVKKGNEEINSANGKAAAATDQCDDIFAGSNISQPLGATCVSSSLTNYASSKSKRSVISTGLQEDWPKLKSRGIVMQFDSHVEHNGINNDGSFSSTSPTFAKVKDEPWDYIENLNVKKNYLGRFHIELPNVKHEREVHSEYSEDQVEHMTLTDRLHFLKARADSSLNISTSYSSLKKTRPFSSLSSPIFSKSAEPSSIMCRRKRKKTATDSVQEALEEDAPGLLQVLLDKGVLVDEIKLYGDEEDDEPLDESFAEDSFSELEAVMVKVLHALVLGIVMDTLIVLERPEYGYATYFFELVESLPVEWQVKRLVIAMKLPTCSRISIIENKELVVGEDLSEGEAKVLMEYGWTPNTGLGTMLNYCDRVVHDRKNEGFSSEWRSKIGKLLVDGYNGGTIVKRNVPRKDSESPVIGTN
ncbi:unnamed protein product [Sphenostylis stenocarpa]|uniref:Uncharacterized protein n=1 Tax=Sphenostylis stenocarpa TaxID=92480 RepID=A0AA86VU83_9FABA|nr:unnamed protein product [Sphenostylis stenocarpa]